jgi:prepilin-type N-terminal cleavage/methylation domain-containing protein
VRADAVGQVSHLTKGRSKTCLTSRRGARAASRGFTILEVLLTIAIIALLASVLIGGAARLLSEEPVTAHDVFWKAVQEARKAALKAEHDMRLKFDKEKKQFVIVDGIAPVTLAPDGFTRQESPIKVFPIAAASEDLNVEFLGPVTKGAQTILIAGMLQETRTISFVTFYSDGTCSPFRA